MRGIKASIIIGLVSLFFFTACGEEAGQGLSDVNVLPAKTGHKAFWTGSEMIVWGGTINSSPTRSGGWYNPTTDSWTRTSIILGG